MRILKITECSIELDNGKVFGKAKDAKPVQEENDLIDEAK